MTWEELQEFVADNQADHWLICDTERGGEDVGLSELLSTGSVTITVAGRHFVIALVTQEVDANGQVKE